MDTDFEADFKLDTKRSKGTKNRRLKEFKQFAKSGTIEKHVMPRKMGPAHRTINYNKKHPELNEVDPFNLDFDVEYSLNKKNRWGRVDEARRVEQLEDLAENVKVTTVEKVFLISQVSLEYKPLTTAYHEVDESGNYTQRRARRFVAQEHTLTEKPRLPRKQRDAEALKSDVKEVDPDASVHVRYEIMTAHPSEKYWRAQYWSVSDINKWKGNVSSSRGKKASLNRHDINSYADDYFSESETDNFEDDLAISNEDDRPHNDYSLFDFVNKSTKKPKKSERFEFVETGSVQSLSSDEDSDGGAPSGYVSRARQIPSASNNLFSFFTINLRSSAKDTSDNSQTTDLLEEIQDPRNIHKESELTGVKLSEKYQLIPSSPKRYLFDLSEQVTGQRGDKEKFIVVLERRTANKIGITLNGNLVIDESVSNIRSAIVGRCPKNIESLLFSVLQHLRILKEQNLLKTTQNQHQYSTVHKAIYQAVPSNFFAQTETVPTADLMSEAIRRFVESPYEEDASTQMAAPQGSECGICFCSLQLDATAIEKCGHLFCNECWQEHCRQQLRTGYAPIQCPDASCNVPVPLSMVMSILPVKHFAIYKKMLLERYSLEHSKGKITQCPGCNNSIIIIASSDFGTLSCSHCNISWCQMCQKPVHWPLDCEQVALYNDRFDKQKKFSALWFTGPTETSVEVKQCPKCHTVMEKGNGCDHMTCRCGMMFCWRCLYLFGSTVTEHTCNAPKQTTTVELRDIKKLCLNNNMAKVFFKKCQEFRTRRMNCGTSSKIRNATRRMGVAVDERNFIINARIEALYLMEFAFAWLYVCGKGRLFGAIRSLCDRLEFACSQLERCCLDEVKNECQKKMTDCQALSQQLIGSLREARIIIMQYKEDK
uniref:RBR-type E3 ubiquitin transferase n=1 Tax=Plectus sambesii TaxID=2011161 RepID=A0A914WNC6_9BILA